MYWKPNEEQAAKIERERRRAGFTDEQIREIERKASGPQATAPDIIKEARISGSPMHLVYARISRLEREQQMETYDKVRDRTVITDPLEALFASTTKLEEERNTRSKMPDTLNPPNTQMNHAKLPKNVPATLDTATPVTEPVKDGKPTAPPIAAASGAFPPPATPEGNIDLVAQAANAAAIPKAQLPPSVIPADGLKSERTVTMTFPHRVLLTIDHETQIEFKAGIQEVPEQYADHSYLKANRVVRYAATSAQASTFPATVPSGESKFCPNCGKLTALHTGSLRACPV